MPVLSLNFDNWTVQIFNFGLSNSIGTTKLRELVFSRWSLTGILVYSPDMLKWNQHLALGLISLSFPNMIWIYLFSCKFYICFLIDSDPVQIT